MRRFFCKGTLWAGMLIGLLLMAPAHKGWGETDEVVPVSGKKQAYMGDPGRKRGLELGFDQGYMAAQADLDQGLEPDLSRHETYNDPKPFYRYEFGNRGSFYNGFRSGFIVGYRQVLGRGVSIVPPRFGQGSGSWGAAGMEAESVPGGGAGSGAVPKKSSANRPSPKAQVLSDAL